MAAWWESDPVVDVIPNRRIWMRRISRAVTLLAALGRVWWPVWVPIVVLHAAGLGLVSAVVAVTVACVGLALARPRVRVWAVGLPMATTVSVFRWRWPRICAQASIAVAVDGAVRHPRLVEVELHGSWWRPWRPYAGSVLVKPLGVQDRETWDRIAARLGQTLDFAVATPRPDDTLLEVRLRRTQLAPMVVVGQDVALEAIAPDPAHVHVGDSALGEQLRWSLDDPTRPHALVAGGTGGGKGNVARLVLVWAWLMLRAGERLMVLVANPKMAGEFRWCSAWAAVASTTSGIVEQIRFVHEQMAVRGVVCLEHGVDHFNELPAEVQSQLGGRLLLILDEWSDFITDPFLSEPKQVMGMAVSIVRKGRALGINVMANGQHITGELFSPANTTGAGTAMIGSMSTRIAVGSIEASGAKTMFGNESVAASANGDIAGRAFTRGLGSRPGGQEAVAGQIWFVPRPLVEALGAPVDELAQAPDFDQLAAVKATEAAVKAEQEQDEVTPRRRNRRAS